MRPEHDRARQMRSAMSAPEVILWSRLKRLRERGFHIRRQAPFKGYYLDFVCYARRVVVLERHGFRVLRVWASDVRYELDWVMDQIVGTLEAASMTEGARRGAQRLAHTSPP